MPHEISKSEFEQVSSGRRGHGSRLVSLVLSMRPEQAICLTMQEHGDYHPDNSNSSCRIPNAVRSGVRYYKMPNKYSFKHTATGDLYILRTV